MHLCFSRILPSRVEIIILIILSTVEKKKQIVIILSRVGVKKKNLKATVVINYLLKMKII